MKSATGSKYEIDMCSGPLLGKLISFSVPLMLASNLQLLLNAVDVIVVGNIRGSHALAAVGSTTAYINLLLMFLIGISLGSTVLAGRYFASGSRRKMEDTVHTSMMFALLGGIAVALVGIFTSRWVLILMSTPADILDDAVRYIRIFFLGIPFFMLYTYGAAILRAVGDTKRPLIYLLISGVLNAGLNILLLTVFNMGVEGVAIATVAAELLSAVLVIRCLHQSDGTYRLDYGKLRIRPICLLRILRIGLPAGTQSLVINFSNALLQASVNTFGANAVAGYTAASNIFGFMYVTANTFTQTCMSFMSQNFGVRKWGRMLRVLWQCTGLSVAAMLIAGLAVYFFRDPILGIYSKTPEAVAAGAEVLLYTTTTYFIFALMDLLPGAMRAIGYSSVPMILSVIGTVGTRIWWIYGVFPHHRALDFLFISYPLSWILTVAMQVIFFVYAWKKVRAEASADI